MKKKEKKPVKKTPAKPKKKPTAKTSPAKAKQPAKKKPAAKKEKFPHFRWYIKAEHPALVTKEHSEDEYSFRKVMHGEKDGRHKNEKISPNPDPKDPNPMYIAKRERHDKKKLFGKKYPWEYPDNKKK